LRHRSGDGYARRRPSWAAEAFSRPVPLGALSEVLDERAFGDSEHTAESDYLDLASRDLATDESEGKMGARGHFFEAKETAIGVHRV
jgi:hypothetical protein